jgi:hypothetical protein
VTRRLIARVGAVVAVVALTGAVSACTPDERVLWARWFAEDPVAATDAVTDLPPADLAADVDVVDPVTQAALTAWVAALEAALDTPQDLARRLACSRHGWGCSSFAALAWIIDRETGGTWDPGVVNRSSGACGLPQALPCSKLPGFPHDAAAQLEWMAGYIDERYGGPWAAQAFWRAHGWY